MKSVDFPEANLALAKDQPGYQTLYVHVNYTSEAMEHIACLELTDQEIEEIVRTRKIFFGQSTYGHPYQPLRLTLSTPFVEPIVTDKQPMDDNRVSSDVWDKTHFMAGNACVNITPFSVCTNCGGKWNEHLWSTRQCEL